MIALRETDGLADELGAASQSQAVVMGHATPPHLCATRCTRSTPPKGSGESASRGSGIPGTAA